MQPEIYVVVDVESCGRPVPTYSMLSFGACVVGKKNCTFYQELKPLNDKFDSDALSVCGGMEFWERCRQDGVDPLIAMTDFVIWLSGTNIGLCPRAQLVFASFSEFDWTFMDWYLINFLRVNPFGFTGLDIKSFLMAKEKLLFQETTSSQLPEKFRSTHPHTHNALDDAIGHAETFEKMLAAQNVVLKNGVRYPP